MKRTEFLTSIVTGLLFIFSAIMMYHNDKDLVYPILSTCAGVLMFIYAFGNPKQNVKCYEKEQKKN